MGDRPKLTPKQERFIVEYLVDRNATQAAIRAGYSAKTAHTIGHENLNKPEIAERVAAKAAQIIERVELKTESVLEEIRRLALFDPALLYDEKGDFRPLREWPPEARACIAGIEVEEIWDGRGDERRLVGQLSKVKFWSKTEALKVAAQYLKLIGDGSATVNVNIYAAPEQRRDRIDHLLAKRAANAA